MHICAVSTKTPQQYQADTLQFNLSCLQCTTMHFNAMGSITILPSQQRQKTAFKSKLEYYTVYNMRNDK